MKIERRAQGLFLPLQFVTDGVHVGRYDHGKKMKGKENYTFILCRYPDTDYIRLI